MRIGCVLSIKTSLTDLQSVPVSFVYDRSEARGPNKVRDGGVMGYLSCRAVPNLLHQLVEST